MKRWLLAGFFCLLLGLGADAAEQQYIVRFSDAVATFSETEARFHVLSEEEFQTAMELGLVAWYEADLPVTLHADSVDYRDAKWDLAMIRASAAFDSGYYGQGIRIAVIDSGLNAHEDLVGAVGYNFLSETTDVTDTIGHGTFVSGMIAAAHNDFGIDGLAPQATVIPLKCFDSGVSTYVSTIAAAIYSAVDDFDADIINMSLGVSACSETLETAVNYALEQGAVIVASVGNLGSQTLYYPAALPNVIGVGSVGQTGAQSSFSQTNESVHVTAPGENVTSTTGSGGYAENRGTSFATPLVSGLAALLLQADPNLTAEEIAAILAASADDRGTPGYDPAYGYGIVDVAAALAYLEAGMQYRISLSTVEGAQIRITGESGLRFLSSIEKTEDFDRVIEFGTVLIPTQALSDLSSLRIGETVNGTEVIKVPAVNRYAEDGAGITFTAVITDIAEEHNTRAYTARAYAIMQDGTVIYGETSVSRSIFEVASRALADPLISEEDRAFFQSINDL